MFFGRTLFGGALTAGIVSAAGAVVCTAALSATPEKITPVVAKPAAAVVTPLADALRTQSAAGYSTAITTAQGAAQVEFRLSGVADATAAAAGRARVDFFAAGGAELRATWQARALRTARARGRQVICSSAAYPAESEVYLVAKPIRAIGRAIVQGTTGYFAHGSTVGKATAEDTGSFLIRTAAGQVSTSINGVGRAKQVSVDAASVVATSSGWGDPFILRGTVRLYDGNGEARLRAELAAEPYVYSVALAVGRITAVGVASKHTPGYGRVSAGATGTAMWQMVVPMVGAPAVLRAEGIGRATARLAARGHGRVLTAASITGGALRTGQAIGAVMGELHPLVRGVALAIRAEVRGALIADATATRTHQGVGSVIGLATATAYNQINDLLRAPSDRTFAVAIGDRRIQVGAERRLLIPAADSRLLAA